MEDYKELYDKASSVIGWDFSDIRKRLKTEGRKWNYIELVKTYGNRDSFLLDIGTGGGELLLEVANYFRKAYGIDVSPKMIKTANKNLKESKVSNVEFSVADSKKIPFKDEYFDIVICRHAPFYAKEVFRVLKPKGIFITQQVAENDKINIKKVFERGQSYGEEPGTLMNKYVKELKEAGFRIIREDKFNIIEYYIPGDLVFLLKNTPIVDGIDIKKDYLLLEKLEREHNVGDRIKTNASRSLIICKKVSI
ncbi:MAG: class I SAM-dependent methyltransferase [Candidatus Woesearchaeota archaeon]|nr:MAG: class I SAM-dependent methyltransferase [Candidatus Woesearchaeota archaeon]